jgi:hypothetical protein
MAVVCETIVSHGAGDQREKDAAKAANSGVK